MQRIEVRRGTHSVCVCHLFIFDGLGEQIRLLFSRSKCQGLGRSGILPNGEEDSLLQAHCVFAGLEGMTYNLF